MNDQKVYQVEIDCVIFDGADQKRLMQKYGKDEFQENFCIHGLTYRWYCDDCEVYFERQKG